MIKGFTQFRSLIVILPFLFTTAFVQAQVAINTDGSSPNASAMLDVTSTTKGILIPRMTEEQRDSISSPATGLMIYQTDETVGFYYYSGSAWEAVGGSSSSGITVQRQNITTTASFSGTDDYNFVIGGSGTYTITLPSSPDEGQLLTMILSNYNVTLSFSGKSFIASNTTVATNSMALSGFSTVYSMIWMYNGTNWIYVAGT